MFASELMKKVSMDSMANAHNLSIKRDFNETVKTHARCTIDNGQHVRPRSLYCQAFVPSGTRLAGD